MNKLDELKKKFEDDLKLIHLRYYIAKAVAAISITLVTIAALIFFIFIPLGGTLDEVCCLLGLLKT